MKVFTPKILAEFLHRAGPMLAQSGQGGRAEKTFVLFQKNFLRTKVYVNMTQICQIKGRVGLKTW